MGTDVRRIGDFLRQISKGANVLDLSMRVWSDAAGQRRAMRFIEIQRLRSIDLCARMRPDIDLVYTRSNIGTPLTDGTDVLPAKLSVPFLDVCDISNNNKL